MVTARVNARADFQGQELYFKVLDGLSTDEKPKYKIANGSKFFELDTGSEYRFDLQTNEWRKHSGGGSGGESYTKEEIDEKLANLNIDDLKQEEPIEIYGGDADELVDTV